MTITREHCERSNGRMTIKHAATSKQNSARKGAVLFTSNAIALNTPLSAKSCNCMI